MNDLEVTVPDLYYQMMTHFNNFGLITEFQDFFCVLLVLSTTKILKGSFLFIGGLLES